MNSFKLTPKIKGMLIISALLLFLDLALILIDGSSGKEKGVLLGYPVMSMILYSNALVLGLSIVFIFLSKYLSFLFVNRLSKRILVLIIPVITVIFLLFLVELVFYFLRQSNNNVYPYAYDSFVGDLFRKDPILGYAANKNVTAQYRKIFVDPANPSADTAFVFNTTVKTDSLGNRSVDIPGIWNRQKYALFFGCSFTFGVGVEDTATIPYYFAKYDTSYCAYNFAVGGYGTQHMLAKLQYTGLRESVKQDTGVCFYIYMRAHPGRVIGDLYTYTNFGEEMPYYDYSNDSITYFGNFTEGRRFISGFYSLMNKSHFIKYFNINFPPKILPKHYKLTCDIINRSYLEYKKQFGNDNFYVVVYPSNDDIVEYLNDYNFKVLDLSRVFNAKDDKYYISNYDEHPTPLANRIVADELINRLAANRAAIVSNK